MDRVNERRVLNRRDFLRTGLFFTASAVLAGCDRASIPNPDSRPNPESAPAAKPLIPEYTPVPLPSPVIPQAPREKFVPPAVTTPKPVEALKPRIITPTAAPSQLLPPKDAPYFVQYVEAASMLKDPYLCAASVGIFTYASKDSESGFMGHGGLFMDESKRPYIMATKHILPANVMERAHIIMPGVGFFKDKSLDWKVIPSTRMGKDPNVAYYFDGQEGWMEKILVAIKEGRITPLTTMVPDLNKPFTAVTSMPERGVAARMGYRKYLSYQNRLIFDLSEGYVCKGYSGQPALVVENGKITNKSCGLVVAGSVSPEIPCNNLEVWVRPHF